jgi:hypothetical protein
LVVGAAGLLQADGTLSDGTQVANVPVTWTAAGGTITAGGLYTAGSSLGTFQVIATQQGGTTADTSLVSISATTATLLQLVFSPALLTLASGATGQFTVAGTWSDGSATIPAVTYSATGGTITAGGLYTSGTVLGAFRVIATQEGGTKADTSAVTITASPVPPSGDTIATSRQWAVADDGAFVEASGTVLRVKFGYDATGRGGWFTGGGGRDGGIVELYYNPTSTTRNLVFRNGTLGSKLDNLDYFQAEGASPDQQGHNTADFTSGVDAVPIAHRVWEDAGRLFAQFDFQFLTWRIRRLYILYPWGDITVHSELTQTGSGRWSYLGHSFMFAVSPYRVQNGASYSWGGNYQSDGESLHAWSDGGGTGLSPYEYSNVIRTGLDENTAMSMYGRQDAYSGFMLDDQNRNDPDIIVMNADSAAVFSAVDQVARMVGGKSYVESGIFTAPWAPDQETHSGMNWFYSTMPCCPVQYANPMLWPVSLGSWQETFHILLRQDLDPADYLAIWATRAQDLGREAPTTTGGVQVRLDPTDRLYHVIAPPGSATIQFTWNRAATATRSTNYRTAFVVENFPQARVAEVTGAPALHAKAYRDSATGTILVQLEGAEPATPTAYTITLTP